MPDDAPRPWPGGLTRIPFWVYKDQTVLEREQQRVFEGPVWNFLCLDTEIPNPGDWRATPTAPSPPSRTAAPIAAR